MSSFGGKGLHAGIAALALSLSLAPGAASQPEGHQQEGAALVLPA